MFNILSQTAKVVKMNFRNRKALLMMVLFPIILIVILGAAFANFEGGVDMKDTKVLYTYSDKQKTNEDIMNKFIDENANEKDVKFIREDNVQKATDKLKKAEFTCYILLKDDGKIEFYKNNLFDTQASLMEVKFSAFTERYNVLSEIAKVNPASVSVLAEDTNFEYTQSKPLQGNRKPRATDYYAITMVTLIILYSSMSGMYGIRSEKVQNTESRMLCSPVKKHQLLIGNIFGSFLITAIQTVTVVVFSIYVLNANWGSNIGITALILASEILMAVSVGVGIAFVFSNESVSSAIINLVVPVIAFVGGAYFPIDDNFGKTFSNIANMSPVRWVNKSMLQLIYDNNTDAVFMTVCINLAIAIAFIIISALLFKREGKTA